MHVPVLVEQVNIVYTESLERLVALFLNVFGVSTSSGHGEAEFSSEEDFAAFLWINLQPRGEFRMRKKGDIPAPHTIFR